MAYNKIEYNQKYNKKHYDNVLLALRRGIKDEWKKAADDVGESLTEYVKRAVQYRIEHPFLFVDAGILDVEDAAFSDIPMSNAAIEEYLAEREPVD